MYRQAVRILVGLLLIGALAGTIACSDSGDGDDDTDGSGETPASGGASTVDVRLFEWAVEPSPASASAGNVTFNVDNVGESVHNILVVKTDLASEALPYDDETQIVDETQVEVLVNSSTLAAGDTEEISRELEPGAYVLLCNLPTHYDLGMHVAFTVE